MAPPADGRPPSGGAVSGSQDQGGSSDAIIRWAPWQSSRGGARPDKKPLKALRISMELQDVKRQTAGPGPLLAECERLRGSTPGWGFRSQSSPSLGALDRPHSVPTGTTTSGSLALGSITASSGFSEFSTSQAGAQKRRHYPHPSLTRGVLKLSTPRAIWNSVDPSKVGERMCPFYNHQGSVREQSTGSRPWTPPWTPTPASLRDRDALPGVQSP